MPDFKPRQSLPPGPFLVVGMARSGQAAARALAGRGETVIGVDSGSPDGAAGLRGSGVEVILAGDGVEEVERAGCRNCGAHRCRVRFAKELGCRPRVWR